MAGSFQFFPGPGTHFAFTAGSVSRFWFYVTASRPPAKFAVTENEGVIGIASFLGGDRTASQPLVQV